MTEETLPVCLVSQIDATEKDHRWLVQSLWSWSAVGFIGAIPKRGKTWLGLDLALSVASGTRCLDAFDVTEPGAALVYLAEDHPGVVRQRLAGMCLHRGIELDEVPVHVITAPSVRLDLERDCCRLAETVRGIKPRLLLLDPLIRLHRLRENDAGDISTLLAFLRELQREHDLAIIVVHHMRKNGTSGLQAGQALRGSGDLHAWTDSALYLCSHRNRVLLSAEHRSAPSPDPIEIGLVSRPDGSATHLEIVVTQHQTPASESRAPLAERLVNILRKAQRPQTRPELRRALRVNNQRLGRTLAELHTRGVIDRNQHGWFLVTR